MKTIERLRELQEVERRARGSSDMMRYVEAVGNTATAAHNALPALLAVVEAQQREIEAWRLQTTEAHWRGTVPVGLIVGTDATLRNLDEVTP